MLKPQDIVILLHLATKQGHPWTFQAIGQELHMSASEVHAGLKRASVARIYAPESRTVYSHALSEFCVHGLKYVFPAQLGGPTRGIATCSGSHFTFPFTTETAESPVWPHPDGTARGLAVAPLYPSLPGVILDLPALYYLLVLVDFIRLGRARERIWAADALTKLLENGGIHGTQS